MFLGKCKITDRKKINVLKYQKNYISVLYLYLEKGANYAQASQKREGADKLLRRYCGICKKIY